MLDKRAWQPPRREGSCDRSGCRGACSDDSVTPPLGEGRGTVEADVGLRLGAARDAWPYDLVRLGLGAACEPWRCNSVRLAVTRDVWQCRSKQFVILGSAARCGSVWLGATGEALWRDSLRCGGGAALWCGSVRLVV